MRRQSRLDFVLRLLPAIVLAFSTATVGDAPPDRVVGLLSLPEVFGRSACDRFTPQDVALYAAPDGQRTGTIRVERNWTFSPDGGCEGLEVLVHGEGAVAPASLPTREYEYEAPAVVVLEQYRNWFRIRVEGGSAWVQATSRDEFFPLQQLIRDRLTYLTAEWGGRLAASPGGSLRKASGVPRTDQRPSVRVVDFRQRDGDLWVSVEVLAASPCASPDDPGIIAKGWLPAHAASGEPAVWFYSRGC